MDILKFSAERFYRTANTLAAISAGMESLPPEKLKVQIEDDLKPRMLKMLTEIKKECEKLSLTLSLMSAKALINLIEGRATWQQAMELHEELNGRIRDEIKSNTFLFIPPTHARFLEAYQPFGAEVAAAFPSADYDILEAGKCFALRRDTACVFHTMRVLEHGLCALATVFAIQTEHKHWNELIEQIEVKVNSISKQKQKPASWKDDEQFYSQAASQFRYFKNAWRNYTAHKQFKYTEEEAEPIYRHVRDFMVHLSKRLKESETP